jgi:hypothetical protein
MLMSLLDSNDNFPLPAAPSAGAELRFGRRLTTGRWLLRQPAAILPNFNNTAAGFGGEPATRSFR